MCNTGMIEKLCSKCKCKKKNMFCFQDDEKNKFKTYQNCRNARKNIMTKTRMILTERGERKEHVMEI